MAPQLPFTGERVVPGHTPIYLIWAHTARYQFVREAVRGKSVLDAGCGEGYGVHYLAQHARQACGVDVSHESVAHAQACYVHPRLSFSVTDCRSLNFADNSFDVVCSFEVIEHLEPASRFLEEVHRVLKPGGTFYVSTPNGGLEAAKVDNPFHEKEFTLSEYVNLLTSVFPSVECYGQVCKRPWREYLFTESTRLYFRSSLYRSLIHKLAPLYLKNDHQNESCNDPEWVEKVNPGTFLFSRQSLENARYILGVCHKEG